MKFVLILCTLLMTNISGNECYRKYFISTPKSGTHLLEKVLNLFVSIGLTTPPEGWCHTFCLMPPVYEDDVKCICIIRDFRDLCCSLTYYIDFAHPDIVATMPEWKNYDFSTKLFYVICGNPVNPSSEYINSPLDNIIPKSLNNLNLLQSLDPSRILFIKFEDLIGPQGGGTKDRQIKTLESIANFYDMPATKEDLEFVASHAFGGTGTYDAGVQHGFGGQIGKWKQCFNEEHKALFKSLYNDFLIEWGYETSDEW